MYCKWTELTPDEKSNLFKHAILGVYCMCAFIIVVSVFTNIFMNEYSLEMLSLTCSCISILCALSNAILVIRKTL